MNMHKVVVRSIDVGYGHVKYTKGTEGPGRFTYASFPSVPVMDTRPTANMVEAGVPGNKVMRVTVSGTRFLVGPDAAMELKSDSNSRVLHDDFLDEEGYLALNYGALMDMGEKEIDYLVAGLPVSLFHARRQDLIDLLQGEHEIAPDTKVTIKNVVVLPQPVGALYNYAFNQPNESIFKDLKNENTLVVDPGYKTFDWVFSRFVHPLQSRSGSYHAGGVSRILEVIAESISKKEGRRLSNYDRLEQGLIKYLSDKKPEIKLWGKPCDISEHIALAKHLAEESVSKLKASVGNGEDVDNIILSGGAGKFFYDALSAAYPNHMIVLQKNMQMANVEGYQQAGIRKAISDLGKQGIDKREIVLV